MMKLIPCTEKEATHVRILGPTDEYAIHGGIYEYHYDPHPSEETHYFITEKGIPFYEPFYDFECVMKCEYYKLIESGAE